MGRVRASQSDPEGGTQLRHKCRSFFYAVLTTVYRNRKYIGASLGFFGGSYEVLTRMLRGAGELLWMEYCAGQRSGSTLHRDRFLADYNGYCMNLLAAVVCEWSRYGFEGAYLYFYALKLRDAARLYMLGEKQPGQLKKTLQAKPRSMSRFIYTNEAWERLDDETD